MTIVRSWFLLIVVVAIAGATPVITFNSTGANVPFGHTGTITYNPVANPARTAVGSGIDIDTLTSSHTAVNAGVTTTCFNCVLDFTTGANISDVSLQGTTWSFAGGGLFTIHGGVDLNHNGVLDTSDIQPGTLLLQGTFNAPVSIIAPGNPVQLDYKFTSGTLITTMDNRLDAFYGDPGNSTFNGVYSQTFASLRYKYGNPAQNHWRFNTYGPTATQYTGMKNGSVVNSLVAPEPFSLLMFGTTGGILALIARRRKMS